MARVSIRRPRRRRQLQSPRSAGLPNDFEHAQSVAALLYEDNAAFTGGQLVLMLVGFIGRQPVFTAHHDDCYLAEHRHERAWRPCRCW